MGRKALWAYCALVVLALSGCGGGGNDPNPNAGLSQEDKPTVVAFTKPTGDSEVVAASGDVITFPESAFPAATQVELVETRSSQVDDVFEQTGEFYEATRPRLDALKVSVQDRQPASDVSVKLSIKDTDREGASADDEFRVMYVNVYDDGTKRLESVEATSVRVSKDAGEIQAVLPKEAWRIQK